MSIDQKMKGWDELGVVDTIYEEEDQEHEQHCEVELLPGRSTSTTASPISLKSSSPEFHQPPSLQSAVEEWSLAHGCKTDAAVRFRDQLYHLHKKPLMRGSRYFHHRLFGSSEVTVTLPLKITTDTFTQVILFCYGFPITLTPWNLAPITVTAELLRMDIHLTDDDDEKINNNGALTWFTEVYFRQQVAGDPIHAKQVLSSGIPMLPDITAASMVARCAEVLDRERIDDQWMEELAALEVDDFTAVADSMSAWYLHDHDLLYQIVDYYLQNYRGSITEESKNSICQNINCNKLSHSQLLHLVQNPRLPLRFIVQAMLIDQLQTRHAYLSLPATKNVDSALNIGASHNATTLGSIMRRDSATREAAQLRSAMEVTSFRIESLERDLDGMRRKLRSSQKKNEMEKEKASSFRVVNEKVRRRGENSKSASVFDKFVNGMKSVFRSSSSSSKKGEK